MNYTTQTPIYKGNIWEYDMSSAGFTMAKKSGLLTDDEMSLLDSLPKQKRVVQLGLLMRDDTQLLDAVEKGIKDSIRGFCEVNDILRSDIISIKRDAVFSTKKATELEIDGAIFREDNKYSSFYLFNRAELFWSTWDRKGTWKGLGKDVVAMHEDHFLAFVGRIITSSETGDAKTVARKLNYFRNQYVTLKLEKECYIECNKDSMYRHHKTLHDANILTKAFPGIENVNPIFNYREFILPLFSVLWRQS